MRRVHACASTRARPARWSTPHVLDATRCISYLTIEIAGAIPDDAASADWQPRLRLRHLPGRVPVEPGRPAHRRIRRGRPRAATALRAAELWQRTDNELHQFVKGSAMTHLSLAGLRRNLATVIGNSGDRVAGGRARPTGPRRQERRAQRAHAGGRRRGGLGEEATDGLRRQALRPAPRPREPASPQV